MAELSDQRDRAQRHEKDIAVMSEKISNMEVSMSRMEKKLDKLFEDLRENYVSKAEFFPVKSIVYGLIGAIGLAVIGAILSVVLR